MATIRFTENVSITGNTISGMTLLDGETTAVQRTLTSPFYPSRNVITTGTGNGLNITSYIFEGPSQGLRFANGASVIFGRPRYNSTAPAGTQVSATNAPYVWNTTTGEYESNFDNTVVDIDNLGQALNVEERVNIVIRTDEAENAALFTGDATCRPIFYGVDFDLGGYDNNMNVIGTDGNSATPALAAPQFYGCQMNTPGTTIFNTRRFLGTNYVIRGLSMTTAGEDGPLMEISGTPTIGSTGITLRGPNYDTWRLPLALFFVESGGRASSADARNRIYFDTLAVPSMPIWFGNGTGSRTFSPDRGVTLRNPIPARAPYENSGTGNTGSIPIMGNQNSSRANLVDRTGAGSTATFQTVNFNFDAPGYTLRIRREEVSRWGFIEGGRENVLYAGQSKESNGSYAFTATTEVPTLGNATPTTTEAIETSNFNYISYDGPESHIAYDGLDAVVTGSSGSVALLASHQAARDVEVPSGGFPNFADNLQTKFFRYTVWGHHDERGITNTVELDFTPEGWEAMGSNTTAWGTGTDINIDLSSPLDGLYTTNTIDPTSTTFISATTQDSYNAAKVFQRVRDSQTAYDSSRLNSEVQVVAESMTGNLADFGALNVSKSLTTTQTGPSGLLTGNWAGGGTGAADAAGITRIGGGTQRLQWNGSAFALADNQFNTSTTDGSGTFLSAYTGSETNNWTAINSILVDDTEIGSADLRTNANDTFLLIYQDNTNWALFTLGTNSQNDIQTGFVRADVRQISVDGSNHMGALQTNTATDVLLGSGRALFFGGGTVTTVSAPAVSLSGNDINIPMDTPFTRGGNVEGFTTTGNFDADGLHLPGVTIDVGFYTTPPEPGEADTAGGIYRGAIALAPGSYNINGDWSDMVVTRSGTTGTAILNFQPGSVRPIAPLGANVDAPFTLSIDSRMDTGGRLSVYKNGTLEPYVSGNTNPATFSSSATGAGTDDFVVVYTAPGRTDFRMTLNNLLADTTVTVTNEAQPVPGLGDVAENDVIGANVATFTASTTAGRGIITIINDTEWVSSTVANYGIQHLCKGTEVYNNILNISNIVNAVRSLGPESAAEVNGTVITFESASPKTIGFVQRAPGSDPLATLTRGRFFSATTSIRVSSDWDFSSTDITAADSGDFSLHSSRSRLDINNSDEGNTDRSGNFSSIVSGDVITVTDSSDAEIFQALIVSNTDQTGFTRLQFAEGLPLDVTLTDNEAYTLAITDAAGSTIPVGVTINLPAGFDPGITSSQISSAVATISTDVRSIVDDELRRGVVTNVGRPRT